MAKGAEFWETVKKSYFAGKTQAELVREFGISKGALSKKVNTEGWDEQKVNSPINLAVSHGLRAKEAQIDFEEVKKKLFADEIAIVSAAVDKQTKYRSIFVASALKNQFGANKLLEEAETMSEYSQHSNLTVNNAKTCGVLMPDTMVQVNNAGLDATKLSSETLKEIVRVAKSS